MNLQHYYGHSMQVSNLDRDAFHSFYTHSALSCMDAPEILPSGGAMRQGENSMLGQGFVDREEME